MNCNIKHSIYLHIYIYIYTYIHTYTHVLLRFASRDLRSTGTISSRLVLALSHACTHIRAPTCTYKRAFLSRHSTHLCVRAGRSMSDDMTSHVGDLGMFGGPEQLGTTLRDHTRDPLGTPLGTPRAWTPECIYY